MKTRGARAYLDSTDTGLFELSDISSVDTVVLKFIDIYER